MPTEHETATVAWMRAEGGEQLVFVREQDGDLKPARRVKDAKLVKVLAIREAAIPKCYNVVTSAGTVYAVHAASVFLFATPAQAEAYNEVARTL